VSFATSSIFSRTFVGVGTYSMSGTVFADAAPASSPPAEGAPDADADATGGAALLGGGVVAGAVLVVAPAVVPELAGAPVDVEVPEGVHAVARARSGKSSGRKVDMTRAW
jgi:hypothetical protein